MSFLQRLRNLVARERMVVKVAWLGLDHAGKTTIIRRVTSGVFDDSTVRTLGMNVDEFEVEGVKFVCWDIGGQVTFREALWKSYMAGSMGVIYVVDSADEVRFNEARRELWTYVINNNEVGDIPILVLANKQDLPEAKSAGQVAMNLDLHKVVKHSYAIVPTSAKSGFNIEEALEWLRQRISEKVEQQE